LAAIAMKELLEAGVHFGHQTKRWNPKMKEYIFGERNGIYILDLGKTVKLFNTAEQFVSRLAAEGRTILFVGTKRQAKDVIAEEAERCGMFHVNERWLGGMLTNFATIQRSLGRLRDLEAMATVAQILSTPDDNLWTFELPDGRSLGKAVAYLAPYIRDKKKWPLPPDVMYDDQWPMRQSALLFAGVALANPGYIDLWKTLRADSQVEETIRNFFIRQPVLWVD
jgi:hypothetical protein